MLLADEPTGNLDTANTAEILNIITDLNHENGITVIVVTHERDVADRADRIITLSDGQVISDETKPSSRSTGSERTISRSRRIASHYGDGRNREA